MLLPPLGEVRERLPDNEHEHRIQVHPGQEGIAIHSHRALLGRLAADGCKPRHGRCDRKRERSYSGLRSELDRGPPTRLVTLSI